MPTVSALLSGGVSVGLLAGVVSGLFYLVVAGIRWAGEVKQQSGEWFYRQVQQRFHPALTPAPTSAEEDGGEGMEAGSAQVRDFIERLVEALVAGDLDNVCIRRLHAHPDYDRMFSCHHAPLCEALARLSFALQMAIANKPMAGQESPSAAHAALKLLIQEIIQEAQTLPDFKGLHYRGDDDDGQLLEDMESKTYEDILATAILNKVIERYQQSTAAGKTVDGNSNLLSPELMSLVAAHKPKFVSSIKIGVNSPTSSDDGRMFTSDADSLSDVSHTDPLAVTIEECIEEVTTFSNVEDDEAEDLPGLDVFKKRRAPFPEYGRDIIDGAPLDMQNDTDEDEDNDELEEDPSLQPTDMINPVDSWEENWLFQKRRLKVGGVPQPMSVPMLVPNPSEDYRALIGDRDAEDVSDLSECSDGALEDLVLADEDIPAEEPAVSVNNLSAKDTQEGNFVPEQIGVLMSNEIPDVEVEHRQNSEEKPIIPVGDAANGEMIYDETDLTEAKNLEYLKVSEDCLSEFGQQEGEYTEDYAALTQRQLDSLIGLSEPESSEIPELPTSPIPQKSPEASDVDEAVVAIFDKLVPSENISESSPGVSVELANPPRPGTELSDDDNLCQPTPGTIAEREHKKWETAPPLPNNPYSSENIYKRLGKKTPFSRMSSNSDISLEFPDHQESPPQENTIDKPLQIICSPSEVDHKKYGRDYYINSQPTDSKKSQRNSPEHHQEEQKVELEDDSTINFIDDQEPQPVEKKVAQWQKEINNTDQYYKNVRNKNLDLPKKNYGHNDLASNGDCQTDPAAFMKSMLGVSDEENENKALDGRKNVNNVKELYENLSKKRNDLNIGDSDTMGNGKRDNYENGSDTFSNGYARSDSPSGSSIVTSDSEYSMPSVRELRKRFAASLAPDSDSSASRSKSVSPAPRVRPPDPLPEETELNYKKSEQTELSHKKSEQIALNHKKSEPMELNHKKSEPMELNHKKSEPTEMNLKKPEQLRQSSLSPPRPVREIHSLTARSISKEFREELRHNHPVPLNRNVYKAGNQPHSNGSDIAEEATPSDRTSSKSPVPSRSMQSSIAFWEQLQKHNT